MVSPTNGSGGLSPKPSPTLSTAPTANSSAPSATACRIYPACSHYSEEDDDDDDDAAQDLKQPCHGWPKLVDVMVENPGFESFQTFRDLNIKSLLYYQAELVQLRKELHALEWRDHRKGGDSARLCSNVQNLLLTTKCPADEDQEQFNKMNRIREVLKDYNAALLQYSQINNLPEAETFNVKSLREWIVAHISGSLNIAGPGKDTWGKLRRNPDSNESQSLWIQFGRLLRSIVWEEKSNEEQLDLVVPGKVRDIDSLTRWVASQWTPFRHNVSIAFKETKAYEILAPFGRLVCQPFRHKDNNSEKELPGGGILAERRRSSNSILSILKSWSLFQQERPVERKKDDDLASLSTYSMSSMIRFTNFVATIIACLLPIVGIAVLSELHTQPKIIGFIALFTAIFATGIMILTDSGTSRTETFTATAAFAAVLVVFVQNQNPGSSSSGT